MQRRAGIRRELLLRQDAAPAFSRRQHHPEAPLLRARPAAARERRSGKLALQWTGGNRTYAVPYGTEAGIFPRPRHPDRDLRPGDISQAHQANEFVARSQMNAAMRSFGKLIGWRKAIAQELNSSGPRASGPAHDHDMSEPHAE